MENEKEKVKKGENNEIEVIVNHDTLDDYCDIYHLDNDCECEECSNCHECACDCECEECNCENCDCDCDCSSQCNCNCCGERGYDEEELESSLSHDFSSQIQERGEEYYEDGRVFDIYKCGNKYYGKVEGHDDNIYDVKLTVYNSNNAHYECTCPCDYPCKHLYAFIIAISNGEYEVVELKKEIMPTIAGIHETIEKIPADELKKYLLSDEGIDHTDFCICSFNDYFRKYLPKQSYEYYYNNLYNAFVLDNDYMLTIDNYISSARGYLKDNEYGETLKIIQSIIEAAHDSDVLDVEDDDFELMNKIGMLLRITYRKGNIGIQNEIKRWTEYLKNNNYYDNYYLEDIIVSLN